MLFLADHALGIIISSVCASVTLHCDGAQGWCRGLKVVVLCSWSGNFLLLLQTFLLQDVSFSRKTHRKTNRLKFGCRCYVQAM